MREILSVLHHTILFESSLAPQATLAMLDILLLIKTEQGANMFLTDCRPHK
jgi:hypothetical protein